MRVILLLSELIFTIFFFYFLILRDFVFSSLIFTLSWVSGTNNSIILFFVIHFKWLCYAYGLQSLSQFRTLFWISFSYPFSVSRSLWMVGLAIKALSLFCKVFWIQLYVFQQIVYVISDIASLVPLCMCRRYGKWVILLHKQNQNQKEVALTLNLTS